MREEDPSGILDFLVDFPFYVRLHFTRLIRQKIKKNNICPSKIDKALLASSKGGKKKKGCPSHRAKDV
jgi:hypothetical protein